MVREIGCFFIGDVFEYLDMFSEVGFVDIYVVVKNLFINFWLNDKILKEIGKISLFVFEFEMIFMVFFMYGLGWDFEVVIVICVYVCEEFKLLDVYVYFFLIIVYGRKLCWLGSVEER